MQSDDTVTEKSINPTKSPSVVVFDYLSAFGSGSLSTLVISNPSSVPTVVQSQFPSSQKVLIPSK